MYGCIHRSLCACVCEYQWFFKSEQLMGRIKCLSASKWRMTTNPGDWGAQGQHPGRTRGVNMPVPVQIKCLQTAAGDTHMLHVHMQLADFSLCLLERKSRKEPSTLCGVGWVLLRTRLPLAMLIWTAGHVCSTCASVRVCVCVCVRSFSLGCMT